MKEDLLHYIWQFKKFAVKELKTVQGDLVEIITVGQYLQQQGPDFFNAQISIGGQKWAGNVEIHINSSDWYVHHHETDKNYDSVILHVVWEHDVEVLRSNNSELPVLELKKYVDTKLLESYSKLAASKSWIYCEKELNSLNSFVVDNWKERLFFERLERKAKPVLELADATNNDWEAVLFCFLARNFGLNSNGEAFFALAKSVPFSIIRKESHNPEHIEALLFGRAGLLDGDFEENYPKALQAHYAYLKHKYTFDVYHPVPVEFFRHRPDNFPSIRLSQLAMLYNTVQNLFSKIIAAQTPDQIYDVFKTQVSPYWINHYRFDKVSPPKRKPLSVSFINLLIINTIVPFKFAYAKNRGKQNHEELLGLMQALAPEKNTVIDKFRYFNMQVNSAYDSQALLQLKKEYCDNKQCMKCAFGLEIIKN
ncbi:DUF2851 family protein [Flavobacterium rhizosphaerae]|uniref:DUF2851 family protein n=1 Tax=Flavobacterium rhizosphaerae TaxID=3163298 RepID=A0ABW8YRB9_9FLAO